MDEMEKPFQSNAFQFWLIVIDYSWASSHSLLLVFNRQLIIEYSNHIFSLSQGFVEKNYFLLNKLYFLNKFINSIFYECFYVQTS